MPLGRRQPYLEYPQAIYNIGARRLRIFIFALWPTNFIILDKLHKMKDKNQPDRIVVRIKSDNVRKELGAKRIMQPTGTPKEVSATISWPGKSMERFQYLSCWKNPSAIHFLWLEPPRIPKSRRSVHLSERKCYFVIPLGVLLLFNWVDVKDPFLNLEMTI